MIDILSAMRCLPGDARSLSYFTNENDRGIQAGLDGCAFFKKGEWQLLLALFFQTLFVSPSVGLLSRKLHRRSNNILLSRRRPLLLYLGAVAKVALQQLRQIYCFMLVIFPRKRLVELEWRTVREGGREGERKREKETQRGIFDGRIHAKEIGMLYTSELEVMMFYVS